MTTLPTTCGAINLGFYRTMGPEVRMTQNYALSNSTGIQFIKLFYYLVNVIIQSLLCLENVKKCRSSKMGHANVAEKGVLNSGTKKEKNSI